MLSLPVLSGFIPPIALPFEADIAWLAQVADTPAVPTGSPSIGIPNSAAPADDSAAREPWANAPAADFNEPLPNSIAAVGDRETAERSANEESFDTAESLPSDFAQPLSPEVRSRALFVAFVQTALPIAFVAWVLGVAFFAREHPSACLSPVDCCVDLEVCTTTCRPDAVLLS